MKEFKGIHKVFSYSFSFNEDTAPDWLKYGGKEGSTMCNRWYWKECVLTLEVGDSVDSEFHTIVRIK